MKDFNFKYRELYWHLSEHKLSCHFHTFQFIMEVTEVTYPVEANPLSLQTLQDVLHLSKNSQHFQSANQNESM